MFRMKCFPVGMVLLVSVNSLAENVRHLASDSADSGPVRFLEQNWTDEQANWFYNVPQGSRLMPYRWFVHLEQPDSEDLFITREHIQSLGYVARNSGPVNPDGLPIGFVRDAKYPNGEPSVGFTCAACHTSRVRYRGTTWVIDGGPGMGDVQRFLLRLVESLQATLSDDAKFDRFARRLDSPDEQNEALRQRLADLTEYRKEFNSRNLPGDAAMHFGHGRVDAFGSIFNQVAAEFLNIPENASTPNAPVSYPPLWDTPQHDRVQWNGAAKNKVSPLGIVFYGSTSVGALGRNAGQVLGVFGHAEVDEHEFLLPRTYASTVNKRNLLELESTIAELWSPQWPRELGELDETRMIRGEQIYADNCLSCHALIDRDDPDRKVVAHISDEGTDAMNLKSFGRRVRTGRLEGRRRTLLGLDRFGAREPVPLVLRHVVERSILNRIDPYHLEDILVSKVEDINELNPGFQAAYETLVGNEKKNRAGSGRTWLQGETAERHLGDSSVSSQRFGSDIDGAVQTVRPTDPQVPCRKHRVRSRKCRLRQ